MDPAGTCGVLGSLYGHHTPGQPCAKRNPPQIQTPATYSPCRHGLGTWWILVATITPSEVPTAHGPGRDLWSFRLALRSSYPRPALCQRNPSSIQTPATYSPCRHGLGTWWISVATITPSKVPKSNSFSSIPSVCGGGRTRVFMCVCVCVCTCVCVCISTSTVHSTYSTPNHQNAFFFPPTVFTLALGLSLSHTRARSFSHVSFHYHGYHQLYTSIC